MRGRSADAVFTDDAAICQAPLSVHPDAISEILNLEGW